MKIKLLLSGILFISLACNKTLHEANNAGQHVFNGDYTGDYLNRVAFPIGGIGAGMICLDGNGAFSSLSVRHTPDIYNTPFIDVKYGTVVVKDFIVDGQKIAAS